MGITKDQAIAAVRKVLTGSERGELLAMLDQLDENILVRSSVSFEDGDAAIVSYVRNQPRRSAHEVPPGQLPQLNAGANERVPTVMQAQRAVLPLKEIKSTGRSDTVGTAVVIASNGVFLTALHTVAWNGKVYPEALQVSGCGVTFIKSFPTDDIAVLQLHSGMGGAGPWPCVQGASTGELQSTTPVLLMGYAQCVEQEGMLSARQPLITHGLVSHTTEDGHHTLADYTGFPNCSGGAVVSTVTGNLMGIHIGEVSHPTEPDTKKARKPREPTVVAGLPPQAREKRSRQSATVLPPETRMDTLQADVRKAQAKLESKGAVGYFVPCTRLRDLLVQAGVSAPSAETLMLHQLTDEKLEEDE